MNTLADRLNEAMEETGKTPHDIATACGAKVQAVYQWQSGATKELSAYNLLKTAGALGVSPMWLLRGIGKKDAGGKASEDHEMTPVSRVNFKLSAGLTGYNVEPLDGEGPPIFFRKEWLIRKGWQADKLLACLVNGSSMEPSLWDGDLVVVNTADTTPRDGDVFAVNYEGELVIKRLRRDAGEWWLSSDNPDKRRYGDKAMNGSALLIGRVVYKQSEVV